MSRQGWMVDIVTATALVAATSVASPTSRADACPFCGVIGQSLSQRRDAADRVAVGEAEGIAAVDATGVLSQRFHVHQMLRGRADAQGTSVSARVSGQVRGTAILFYTRADEEDRADGNGAGKSGELEQGRWLAVSADEALLGYVATAPAVSEPAAKRLEWFAAKLEHPQPQIAEDAFVEFGTAPLAAVQVAAGAIHADRLQQWVIEPAIDSRRRGFYGLALGIVASQTPDPSEKEICIRSLHGAIEAPADDFRAGFDGVMAGLLVAEGERGLRFLEKRGLFGPDARAVDQRHLLASLRFAWESLADSIPRDRIAEATAKLLARRVVAADATIDLARYRAWQAVDDVAQLWNTLGPDDPLVRRAVAGYLTACPLPAAQAHLEKIERRDPTLLSQALEAATLLLAR